MYIYIYMYINMYICVYMYINLHIHTCTYIYISCEHRTRDTCSLLVKPQSTRPRHIHVTYLFIQITPMYIYLRVQIFIRICIYRLSKLFWQVSEHTVQVYRLMHIYIYIHLCICIYIYIYI